MLSYAVKRVLRSFGLFAALLLGVVLASAFFAGVNIGADTTAKAALLQQLNRIPVDITISGRSVINSDDWKKAVEDIGQINGVVGVEIISISRGVTLRNKTDENYMTIMVTAISNTSKVYDGLRVTEGAPVLGVNETYVWIGSKAANKIALNSTLILNFTYCSYSGRQAPEVKTFYVLPLKVAGFADLEDKAYSIATGEWGTVAIFVQYAQAPSTFYDLLLIVDWEKTFTKVLDHISEDAISYHLPISTQILVYLDRDSLINPWDIPTQWRAVESITSQITNMIGSKMYASNNIRMILMTYYATSMRMRFSFIVMALPVFFVAWYVGTTVSDVSYNLRRREIGLLLTKGFSNSQLFRLFLTESILIGIIGGLAGVGLGFLLRPIFTTASGSEVSPVLSTEVIIITIIFGLAVTLLSTFRPSRKAAKLPPVEALREYTYIEEVKPYKQRGPWIAFILGLYKIVTFLLGNKLGSNVCWKTTAFHKHISDNSTWHLDYYRHCFNLHWTVALFLGIHKNLYSRFSKVSRTGCPSGEVSRRFGNPSHKKCSEKSSKSRFNSFSSSLNRWLQFPDHRRCCTTTRLHYPPNKGGNRPDISISPSSTINITRMMEKIENLTGVASATLQYSISGSVPGDRSRQIIAVDPDTWLSTAYYEEEWFSGNNVATAFQLMKAKNQTIILERSVASRFNKEIGDVITITIGSSTLGLEIVGFFGPEITQEYGSFWSYIPMELYESLSLGWQPSATILAKLKPDADGKAVASDIRKLEGVNYVRSVAEELENLESNLLLIGPLNIQRLELSSPC